MGKDKKRDFKWRGVATFSLISGIFIETITGIVLYIVPVGRIANWTNWTLLGLTKQDWAALHTIFGYFLIIIIGLHLYFNWRVIVHFFWNKVQSAFNLKREFVAAAVVTLIVFAGTIWNVPPFSSVMDLGREAKLSWAQDGGPAQYRGGRWTQTTYENESVDINQRGGGRWFNAGNYSAPGNAQSHESVTGYGRSKSGGEVFAGQGQERDRMINQRNSIRPGSGQYVENRTSETLKGRDFVRLGQLQTFKGNLIQKGDEWELKSGDKTYEIHMGPSDYRTNQGLILRDGEPAVVMGYVYGNDISVTTIEAEGKTVTLRNEGGRAAWSGTGFARGNGRAF